MGREGDEPRAVGSAAAEQAAESVFGVEKIPGVAGGVARGKSTGEGHYEGDEDNVVVVGVARICCCFSLTVTD